MSPQRRALGITLTPVNLMARCIDCSMDLVKGEAAKVKRGVQGHIDTYMYSFGERHRILLVAEPDEPLAIDRSLLDGVPKVNS